MPVTSQDTGSVRCQQASYSSISKHHHGTWYKVSSFPIDRKSGWRKVRKISPPPLRCDWVQGTGTLPSPVRGSSTPSQSSAVSATRHPSPPRRAGHPSVTYVTAGAYPFAFFPLFSVHLCNNVLKVELELSREQLQKRLEGTEKRNVHAGHLFPV